MLMVMSEVYGNIVLPDGPTDLNAFIDWRHRDGVPEKLKAHYHRGHVWVDLMEETFSHNQVKTALGATLGPLVAAEDLGLYFIDGVLLRNDRADLSTEPDAMFVSNQTLAAGVVTFTAGKKRGAVATVMVGTPDLVVEVVSLSSEGEDAAWMMSAYHNAGIPEYWLIDARRDDARFHIYRRRPKGFVAVRGTDGWLKSPVLARSFRLTKVVGKAGLPRYTLEVR